MLQDLQTYKVSNCKSLHRQHAVLATVYRCRHIIQYNIQHLTTHHFQKSVNACGESQVVVVSRLPAIPVSVLLTDWLRD